MSGQLMGSQILCRLKSKIGCVPLSDGYRLKSIIGCMYGSDGYPLKSMMIPKCLINSPHISSNAIFKMHAGSLLSNRK